MSVLHFCVELSLIILQCNNIVCSTYTAVCNTSCELGLTKGQIGLKLSFGER